MKFVKGDAIAGIVITFINIVGGMIIGYDDAWHDCYASCADLFSPFHW